MIKALLKNILLLVLNVQSVKIFYFSFLKLNNKISTVTSCTSWISITVTKFYSSSLYSAFDMITASRAHHSQKQKNSMFCSVLLPCFVFMYSTTVKLKSFTVAVWVTRIFFYLLKYLQFFFNFIVKKMVFCVHEPLILYNYDKILI